MDSTPDRVPSTSHQAALVTDTTARVDSHLYDDKTAMSSQAEPGSELSPSLASEPASEEPEPDVATAADGSDSSPASGQVPPRYSVFTLWEKRLMILGASLAAFFSPVTAQIYLPALNAISADLHITSTQVNLTVTTYMIFQGVTPMFVGGFADGAGRRPAYIICFVIYIVANIGLALSKNYASLLVIRCLQSAGSSSTVALCQAVVADVITSAERGQYIGITVLPIVLAPSLGPVIGGLLSQYLGWRSIFWFLAISSAVVFVLLLLFLPETCRKIVGDGSIRPHPFYRTFYQLLHEGYGKRKARRAASAAGDGGNLQRATSMTSSASRRPLKIQVPNLLGSLILLFQKEIGLLLLCSGVVFAGFYAVATAMPSQFAENYGFNELTIGLMYLPMAGGSIVTGFVMGPLMNWNYRRHAKRLGMPVDKSRQQDLSNFPIEQARLQVGLPLLAVASFTVIGWGWAFEKRASVAVPCVLLFLLGICIFGFSNTVSALLIDVAPGRAGAAIAANNLTRCLIGAGASAAVVPLINAMGAGWAFVLIGLLYLLFTPMLLLVMYKGMAWRKQLREGDERREAKKQQKRQQKQASEAMAIESSRAHSRPTGAIEQQDSDEKADQEKADLGNEKRQTKSKRGTDATDEITE